MKRTETLSLLAGLLLLVACDADKKAPGEIAKVKATEAEVTAFARSIEHGIMQRQAKAIDTVMDINGMFSRVFSGKPVGEDDRKKFIEDMGSEVGTGEQIVRSMGEEGGFRFLSLKWNDGHPVGVYRLVTKEGNTNYLELLFSEREEGGIGIADVYTYGNGEYTSDIVRRLIIRENRNVADLFKPEQITLLRGADSLVRLVNDGQYNDAVQYFESLPPEIRRDKVVQAQHVRASQQLGEEQHLKALEEFKSMSASDSVAELMMIDYYAFRKEYDQALAVVDRLEKRVGDPYLNVMRAYIRMEQGDMAAAREMITKAIAADSTLPNVYEMETLIALRAKDYRQLAASITTLEKRFGRQFDPAVMAADTTFAGFVSSPEYQEWMRGRTQQ